MFFLYMSIDTIYHSFYELCSFWLLNGLMHMHYITHHLCMEGNWVPHSLLKFKVLIVFKFLTGRGFNTLIGHVVHVLFPIEIALGNRFLRMHESFLCLPLELVPADVGMAVLSVGGG